MLLLLARRKLYWHLLMLRETRTQSPRVSAYDSSAEAEELILVTDFNIGISRAKAI